MPTSADAPDILLARLLACRNRDELTALVRARPRLLDEPVEASPGELAAQRPDPAVARTHLRSLRAMRGLHGELTTLACRADELQRAFTASGNVAELTAAVSAWQAALAHPRRRRHRRGTADHGPQRTPHSSELGVSCFSGVRAPSLYRYGSRVAIRIRLASGRCPLMPMSAPSIPCMCLRWFAWSSAQGTGVERTQPRRTYFPAGDVVALVTWASQMTYLCGNLIGRGLRNTSVRHRG